MAKKSRNKSRKTVKKTIAKKPATQKAQKEKSFGFKALQFLGLKK